MPDRLLLLLGCSFAVTFVLSKVLLSVVQVSRIAIKPELAATQAAKQGTPVIGGLAFSMGTLGVSVFDPMLGESGVLFPLAGLLLFGLVGFLGDKLKDHNENGDGLSSVFKLVLQAQAASILLILMTSYGVIDTSVAFGPFTLHLGKLYYVFALLYILYFVNAVNITDGLDALAGGSSLPLLMLLVILSFRHGSSTSTALLGSLLAFLYFNLRPARYFMGDCGSHGLGAYIALSAILLKTEVVVFFAGGLFLVELATSLIQIIAIRKFGRKVFVIAPLHHAYEMKGVKETKIVMVFTLASWLFSSFALMVFR